MLAFLSSFTAWRVWELLLLLLFDPFPPNMPEKIEPSGIANPLGPSAFSSISSSVAISSAILFKSSVEMPWIARLPDKSLNIEFNCSVILFISLSERFEVLENAFRGLIPLFLAQS